MVLFIWKSLNVYTYPRCIPQAPQMQLATVALQAPAWCPPTQHWPRPRPAHLRAKEAIEGLLAPTAGLTHYTSCSLVSSPQSPREALALREALAFGLLRHTKLGPHVKGGSKSMITGLREDQPSSQVSQERDGWATSYKKTCEGPHVINCYAVQCIRFPGLL